MDQYLSVSSGLEVVSESALSSRKDGASNKLFRGGVGRREEGVQGWQQYQERSFLQCAILSRSSKKVQKLLSFVRAFKRPREPSLLWSPHTLHVLRGTVHSALAQI